ncbi:MAG: preprotein translocase subunit SecG [Verrucomicrobia bacterium 12-59-8]|nr:MAG: preprotein translocase subunit SecG [Verrucomicrobia bacterium 12-59-8]
MVISMNLLAGAAALAARRKLELPPCQVGKSPHIRAPFMDIFIGILTAVEVIVCLLLILVVLMQRPRQEGLGASFGDAAASQVWGAQTTNVLQKFTVYLAIILFGLTILLAVLVSRHQNGSKSAKIFGDAKPEAAAPAAPVSAEEQAKAQLLEKIKDAVKTEQVKAGETPKADEKKDTPAAPAPATTEPAKAPEAPKAPAEAPAPTPAPAPADQPK